MAICICIVFIIILLWLLFYNDIERFTTLKPQCNNVDGRCYSIVENFESSTHIKASEMLAYANNFCIKLLRHLRNKYMWDGDNQSYRYDAVFNLLQNYNPDALIENNPSGDVNTSYVENKGKIFALCLRNKHLGDNAFISLNILEFVILHELSHLTTISYGHDINFWTNFKLLLNEAVEINIHKPSDYSKQSVDYCTLHIDYNPYFDNGITIPN